MKRLNTAFCLAFLCAAMACNDAATNDAADTKAADSPATTAANVTDETPTLKDTAKIMSEWMAYATPGEMHKALAKDAGTWTAEMTMWMTPDAPPQKSTGTSTNKMIMGGRYQQSSFKGDFGGMPFEGQGTVGYDNAKKAYVSTWLDNMGTGIMVMEGTYDAANKAINFTGKSVDASGKQCSMREVFKLVDDKTQVMEMYVTYPGGKEYKNMEITFKRK